MEEKTELSYKILQMVTFGIYSLKEEVVLLIFWTITFGNLKIETMDKKDQNINKKVRTKRSKVARWGWANTVSLTYFI